jgi:PAS domain S-box-containing protein
MLTFAHSTYFHDLLDSFSAGVVIVNIRGLVYASNAAASSLLGVGPKELADPGCCSDIIARTDDPRALARFLAAPLKHARKPESITLAYRHPDGVARHFRLSGSLLLENSKIFGILLELNDMTEIVRFHDRERTMLLGIHAAQQERIESLGRFSLAVAHQIRNPLMVIGGFAGRMLRRRAPGDAEAEALSMILDGAGRLEAVVQAVSRYARRRAPAPVMVDPADLAVRAMETANSRTGIRARFVLGPTTGPIRVDATLLEETLEEILANALEASGATPEVEAGGENAVSVRFCRTDDGIRIEAADQGPGLPEDIRPFLFDPFFTTKAVGVGMGLAIAKRNTEELGGTLRLTPGESGGCLAVLSLPGVMP